MATSSITKNFVISGKEQVEMFVNAIEESAKNRPVRTPVAVKFIKGEEELRELMRFREMKEKEKMDLRQYFGQKKSKDYAVFLSSSSSFCCGVK